MPEEVKVSELNVDEALELVGDDKELAAQALEAEKASDHPRSTLIHGLEAVIAEEPDEPDEVEDDGPGEGEPEEPAAPSDFRPSNQDLAQNAMVSGAQALEERKREQIRANRDR